MINKYILYINTYFIEWYFCILLGIKIRKFKKKWKNLLQSFKTIDKVFFVTFTMVSCYAANIFRKYSSILLIFPLFLMIYFL